MLCSGDLGGGSMSRRRAMNRMIAWSIAGGVVLAAAAANIASAQGTANYPPYQSVGRLKANVLSALNRFTRGRLFNVFGDAAGVHFRAHGPRALNGNIFTIQDRNLEGYPRPRD
jgi:hypothetical protein